MSRGFPLPRTGMAGMLIIAWSISPDRARAEIEPRDQPVVAVLKLIRLTCLVPHVHGAQSNGQDDLYFGIETKNSWCPKPTLGRIPKVTGVISATRPVEVPLHRGTIPLDQTTEVTLRLMERAKGERGPTVAKDSSLGEFRVLLRNSGGRLHVTWQTRGAAEDKGPVAPPRAEEKARALRASRRKVLLTGGGARYEAVLEVSESDTPPAKGNPEAPSPNTSDVRTLDPIS